MPFHTLLDTNSSAMLCTGCASEHSSLTGAAGVFCRSRTRLAGASASGSGSEHVVEANEVIGEANEVIGEANEVPGEGDEIGSPGLRSCITWGDSRSGSAMSEARRSCRTAVGSFAQLNMSAACVGTELL